MHRGVYAVGHLAPGIDARLHAALLYAGHGSALSHATGGWWWALYEVEPRVVHVSAPAQRRPERGVLVHVPRHLDLTRHRGLPVTTVSRTLLDLAASVPPPRLRRALAEAEYRRLVDPRDLVRALGRGRPGSAALRRALELHMPELAMTLSVLEEGFLALCQEAGLPLPQVNATVAGLMVDALWRGAGLVVELDGHAAHGTQHAIERDRQREIALRRAGYRVIRYTWHQVTAQPDLVATDLHRELRRAN